MIELIDNKKHIITKRDGREEPYSEEKLKKVLMWASNNSEIFTKSILESIELKISDKMKIQRLYDEVIKTAANKISVLYPIYDDIARNLYIMKIYKEIAGMKKSGEYPHLKTFLDRGIKAKVYDKKVLDKFSNEDIEELNKALVPDRDFLFTFKGIVLMTTKYCKKANGKTIELPQITYMVTAMYSFYEDYYKNGNKKLYKKSKKNRIAMIKNCYDMMSLHEVTMATPRILNSMTLRPQLASCILNTADDDTWSLNQTDGNMAMYSKFAGGIAYDVSHIRASGSTIASNRGKSDGPVPFIKRAEQTISSFNQSGCIHKDSLVEVLDENLTILLPIEKIKKGFLVKSYNTTTGEIEFKPVEEVFEFEMPFERQYELITNKNSIIITSDHHPIFYKDGETVKCKRTDEMKIGDKVINSSGESEELIAINRPQVSEFFMDLSVKDNNNYFAKKNDSSGAPLLIHNSRKGSGVITFPWWHWDVMDMIMLKDAGGNEDGRARKLMYSIKINRILKERAKKDEYVTLFDPKEVPQLNETYGRTFEEYYKQYENKFGIRKKKIKAKELIFNFLKVRSETGNIYVFFADNVNEQNMLGTYVGSSNLCSEIVLPSFPSKLIEEKIYNKFDGTTEIHTIKKSGEIGICNLASINLIKWVKFSEKKKNDFCYNLLRGCDNILDTQFYPVSEGEVSNKKHRPIGIGVTNYANLLASNKLKYTDKDTEQFTFDIFEDVYYHIYKASSILAKERGSYQTIKNDKWSKGILPINISNFDYRKFGLEFKNKERWDKLAQEIKTTGVRFCLHASLAPTATSAKAISATDSIEPIVDLFFTEEGMYTLPALVPNLKENREYYERCWVVPPRVIIKLAAIRQLFIDQAQSVNLYYIKPDSAKVLWEDIVYAMDMGLKTLYYQKTPKSNFELEVCESCT